MAIRAAVIGCGKRAGNFTRAAIARGGVEMVGFADPAEGRANELASEFGGKPFMDAAAMLGDVQPEFVMLITRPGVRLEPIRLCAGMGVKAMLSEKPMATSWAQARAIDQAARDAGMQLSFCHQRRCDPQFRLARQLVDDGAIGKVTHIVGHCADMYDWGTHYYDMMHYFNGEAEAQWVIAQADRRDVKYVFDQPMDKCGVATVRFANDVTGTLHAGDAMGEGNRMRVIGESGTLWTADNMGVELFTTKGYKQYPKDEDAPRGVPSAIGHAIECCRNGKPSLLDSTNALRATQLVFAAYHSAMTGERVTLPLAEDFDLALADVFA